MGKRGLLQKGEVGKKGEKGGEGKRGFPIIFTSLEGKGKKKGGKKPFSISLFHRGVVREREKTFHPSGRSREKKKKERKGGEEVLTLRST